MSKPAVAEIQRPTDTRAARILARSLFRDMRANGYGNQQILALATEMIDLVTRELRGEGEEALDSTSRTAAPDVELKIVGQA